MAKVGRPTDYSDDLPAKLFQAMQAGKSMTRFCRDIVISTSTFYLWVAKHPEFSSAFEIGKAQCEGHWEDWLIDNMANKDINSTLVKMFFANRFNWSDKSEQKHDVTVSQEDALKELS